MKQELPQFRQECEENISNAENLKTPGQQPPIKFTTDHLGEDRHEFVAKLAYKLWEGRGRPFGSTEVDWFAAERAVYSSLVATSLVSPSPSAPRHEQIYL